MIGAVGVACWRACRRWCHERCCRNAVDGSEPVGPEAASTPEPQEAAARWVDPVEGGCPDGYPIKANVRSGIYHVPGGLSYERTIASRCYVDAGAAEADGYRRARR